MQVRSGSWLDGLLPQQLRDGSESHRRARTFVAVAALLATVSFFFSWQLRAPDTAMQSRVLFAVGVFILCNVAALHFSATTSLVAQLTCMAAMVALGVCAHSGAGVKDPALRWLIAMPLIGGILVRPRFGFVLAVAGALILGGLFYLNTSPGYFREPGPDGPYFELLVGISVAFGTALCAQIFEGARQRASADAQRAIEALDRARAEAENTRERESVAKEAAMAEAALKSELAARMLRNVRELQRGVEEARDSISRMTHGTRAIAETVTGFGTVARESSQTSEEVEKLDQQTQGAIDEISSALSQTATSIEEMRMTLREVGKNVDGLMRNADSTNASMNELDASVQQVEKSARGASDLAGDVVREAARGKSAVTATKAGMDTIRESSRSSALTVRALGQRVAEITAVLDVINQVSDRTNLLALNAAIIAAGAGEAGRGFAVVAAEVKALADETRGSVKSIDEIVRALDSETSSALDAIARSELAVEEGVLLVEEAEIALGDIVRSADESGAVVRSIATTTAEQAQSIRFVASEMERVTQTVSRVANTVREQVRTSEQIAVATERLGSLTPKVQSSSVQQSAGSRRVRDAVMRLSLMVERLGHVQGDQTNEGERVLLAIESLHASIDEQLKSIERLAVDP